MKTQNRISPPNSATDFPVGTIKKGNNGLLWVVKKTNLSHRWIPVANAELNGFKKLTVKYLKQNIGKRIKIYEWDVHNLWPISSAKLFKYFFEPTGNAFVGLNKKKLNNWLKTEMPIIKDKTMFFIEGINSDISALQVDSKNKQLVSSRIMNMTAYVKC